MEIFSSKTLISFRLKKERHSKSEKFSLIKNTCPYGENEWDWL